MYVFHYNIQGYHVHKEIWEASIRETLSCKKNFADNNFADVMQSMTSAKVFSREKFLL